MGQYYKAVNIDNLEYVSSYDFGNGAKLMEHSYISNNFVEAVEFLLINDGEEKGRWADSQIIWAGDYADYEFNIGDDGDPADNYYSLVSDKGTRLKFLITAVPENYPYLVNHTEKEYVDKKKLPTFGENNDWMIHPLPLLVAEGNGRGGGDYHGLGQDYVGRWARCIVNLMKEIPKEYTEIQPDFLETR